MKRVDIISKVVGRDGQGKPVGGGISIPMGNYALKSDFESLKSMFNDFLEGDDTDSVINRWKDLEAFLNGISEDNTLDSILKAYVTLSGTQTITGEKNFTGGLKVNGSPLVYNKESGYWKLEGDLLVTGGVSMFASDTEFTPSTIMDAIVVDNVTIIKQDGKLVALGGGGTGGGGVADAIAWSNVLGKPAWITDSAPSINVSGVNVSLGGSITQSALRTALGLGSNAYSSTEYLPLTGGTIKNGTNRTPLILDTTDAVGAYLTFKANGTNVSYVGYDSALGTLMQDVSTSTILRIKDNNAYVGSSRVGYKTILNSTNYSSYALPLTGGTLSGLTIIQRDASSPFVLENTAKTNSLNQTVLRFMYNGGHIVGVGGKTDGMLYRYNSNMSASYTIWDSGNDGSGSGLDADLLDGFQQTDFFKGRGWKNTNLDDFDNGIAMTAVNDSTAINSPNGYANVVTFTNGQTDYGSVQFVGSKNMLYYRTLWDNAWGDWKTVAFTDSNVASATKLQTARTIWGQSFDGTGNVSGSIIMNNDAAIAIKDNTGTNLTLVQLNNNNAFSIGYGSAGAGYNTYIDGNSIIFRYSTAHLAGLELTSTGRVSAKGNIDLPNNKAIFLKNSSGVDVNSLVLDNSNTLLLGYGTSGSYNTKIFGNNLYLHYGSRSTGMILNNSGNITIGSSDLALTNYKLYVSGNTMQNGKIYFTDSSYISFGNTYLPSKDGSNSVSVFNSDSNPLMTIMSNGITYLGRVGNVCIGTKTTTPTEKLYVQGNILATGGVTTNDSMTINGIKLYKSQDGVLYLDGNLVVRGGVTMYGSDSESAPSILDSLPIASTSAKGIAQFSSAHFTVTDGIVSIIGSNVGLNQTELDSYLTTNKFVNSVAVTGTGNAITSASISGKTLTLTKGASYLSISGGTISNANYQQLALKRATTEPTYGIALSFSNSNGAVCDLVAYGDTKQLKRVAGGNDYLVYDSGNLTKSTLGLGNVENTALSTWVGTSKITTLGTITTGTWNGTKIANTYLANSSITISGTAVSLGGSITQSALRTALGLGSNAYSSVAYLPLTGGTLTDVLRIKTNSDVHLVLNSEDEQYNRITFQYNGTEYASLNFGEEVTQIKGLGTLYYNSNQIYHAGNFNPSNYLPLSGGVVDGMVTIKRAASIPLYVYSTDDNISEVGIRFAFNSGYVASIAGKRGSETLWRMDSTLSNKYQIWDSGNDGSGSGLDADLLDGKHLSDILASNVASATKLQTARTIWGQSFDGTGNVSGHIYLGANAIFGYNNASVISSTETNLSVGYGQSTNGITLGLYGNEVNIYYGKTGSNRGLVLNSSGNITIGSSDLASTTYKLYVDGYTQIKSASTPLRLVTTNTASYASFLDAYHSSLSSGQYYLMNFGLTASKNNSAWMGFYYSGSASTSNRISFGFTGNDNLFNIAASGNVGIGTTTPAYKLAVAGEISTWLDGFSAYSLRDTSRSGWQMSYRQAENKELVFYKMVSNAYTPVMTLTTSDNVGIGTRSPSAKLHVAGNILATGGVTMQSARKLKNIQDERGLSLEELKIIKPTRFTWKDNRDEKIHIGGIADDVMKVLPEVIYKTDDDTLTMDYGNAAFAIAASLIKPVVSHEQRIKVLEEENERLKREIEQLKWHIA